MNTKSSIQGIIFDMDGVLCDSEPFIAEAAVRMFAERHGLVVKPDDFRPFVGMGEDRFLGGVAEKYGIELDMPSDKDLTYAIYLDIIRGRLHPLPGVAEFVAGCRRRGLKLAIATSADRVKLDGNLREIGLSPDMFDACVTGNEVRRKKPAPDIFLTAARKAQMAPTAVLVIEDAPNGIQAAQAAGMRALGITSSFSDGALRAAGADWTAPDLEDVPQAVWDGNIHR
ncbi:MAG: HAD-IA family hydrolase [Verrucomicrobia bacterium]|nr:HAD-IA family hydrolase [Verrucomicrobiota bacterium]MBU1734838.1 HAD-IA family hydrolase [Verrucomicrobiota bacterium]MBU1855924.1 HAD-IA family hydrolase [Verrucomicrobiota bacterium]